MKNYLSISLLLILLPTLSFANLIIQDEHTNGFLIVNASPVGQTFTAEDPYIHAIGFYVADWNPHTAPHDHDLSAELYSGVGNGGTLIGTSTISNIADGYEGWLLFELGTISLKIGDMYSMFVINNNSRWGLYSHQHSYPSGSPIPDMVDYVGGDAILGGNVTWYKDLTFMVVPVPEPATVSLFVIAGLLLRTRKD